MRGAPRGVRARARAAISRARVGSPSRRPARGRHTPQAPNAPGLSDARTSEALLVTAAVGARRRRRRALGAALGAFDTLSERRLADARPGAGRAPPRRRSASSPGRSSRSSRRSRSWSVLSLFAADDARSPTRCSPRARCSPCSPASRSARRSRTSARACSSRFTQPLRLGDRVTVGEQTGFVEEMTLIYTTLVTDDGRRVFIPNTPADDDDDRQPHDPRSAPGRRRHASRRARHAGRRAPVEAARGAHRRDRRRRRRPTTTRDVRRVTEIDRRPRRLARRRPV